MRKSKNKKKTDVLNLVGPLKVDILGPLKVGILGPLKLKISKFSLKFRAIFENYEKEQKKNNRRFNLVGLLKVDILGPLKVEKFWRR